MWNRVPSVVKTHYPATQTQNFSIVKNVIDSCMPHVQLATPEKSSHVHHREYLIDTTSDPKRLLLREVLYKQSNTIQNNSIFNGRSRTKV